MALTVTGTKALYNKQTINVTGASANRDIEVWVKKPGGSFAHVSFGSTDGSGGHGIAFTPDERGTYTVYYYIYTAAAPVAGLPKDRGSLVEQVDFTVTGS